MTQATSSTPFINNPINSNNDNHQINTATSTVNNTTNNTTNDTAIHNPANTPILWLIDDDPALRLILEDTFSNAGLQVVSFTNAHGAWTQLNEAKASPTSVRLPQVIVTDIRMPMMDGLSFSQWLNKEFNDIPVIIMTAHSDLQSAIDSYQTGVFEYLPKPFDLDEAVRIVHKAIAHSSSAIASTSNTSSVLQHPSSTQHLETKGIKNRDLKNRGVENRNSKTKESKAGGLKTQGLKANNLETKSLETGDLMIGQSPVMQTVFRAIGKLANTPISVLITGESGTGKELVANALHQTSSRKDKPFIALNMSAIPHDLIESELFGHEKGAFTGATTSRKGRFEQADGGTLFLDEIGDMPFNTQTRLLRVLANGEFFRVGGKDPIQVDVRIISATHQNLEHLVKQGKFREDLFYRLNVIRLPLPALRKRPTDIPALLEHFLQQSAIELATTSKSIDPTAMQILQSYPWYGNVRQLENTCRWLTVMTSTDIVYPEDLPPELLEYFERGKTSQIDNLQSPQPRSEYHTETQLSANSNQDNKNNNTSNHASNDTNNHEPKNDWLTPLAHWAKTQLQQADAEILPLAQPEFERVLINTTLLYCKGNKVKASQRLGWGRNTLTRKIKQLGLDERW